MGRVACVVRPKDPLEDFLDDFRDDGQAESEGQFSIDPVRGRELLREHQHHPHAYVLNMVACAVADGAGAIEVRIDTDELWLEWSGSGFSRQELLELNRHLLVPSTSETVRLHELAHALHGAWVGETESSWFETRDLRIVTREAEPVLTEVDFRAGGYFYRRTRAGAGRFLKGLVSGFAEEQLLRERCRYCPVPITVNGRPLPRSPERLGNLFQSSGDGLRVSAFRRGEKRKQNRLVIVLNGVAFPREVRGLAPFDAELTVWVEHLNKDLSQTQIIDDRDYQQMFQDWRRRIREHCRRALSDLPENLTGRDGRAVLFQAADECRRKGDLDGLWKAHSYLWEDRARDFEERHPAVRRAAQELSCIAQLKQGHGLWRDSGFHPARPQEDLTRAEEAIKEHGPGLDALITRALALARLGRLEEAERVAGLVARRCQKEWGEHWVTAAALNLQAGLALLRRQPEEARSFLEAARGIVAHFLDPTHPIMVRQDLALAKAIGKVGPELAQRAHILGEVQRAWVGELSGAEEEALQLARVATQRPWEGDPFFGLVVGFNDWFSQHRVKRPQLTPFGAWSNLAVQQLTRRLLKPRDPQLAKAILNTRVGLDWDDGRMSFMIESPRQVVGATLEGVSGRSQQVGDTTQGCVDWSLEPTRLRVDFQDGFSWAEWLSP